MCYFSLCTPAVGVVPPAVPVFRVMSRKRLACDQPIPTNSQLASLGARPCGNLCVKFLVVNNEMIGNQIQSVEQGRMNPLQLLFQQFPFLCPSFCPSVLSTRRLYLTPLIPLLHSLSLSSFPLSSLFFCIFCLSFSLLISPSLFPWSPIKSLPILLQSYWLSQSVCLPVSPHTSLHHPPSFLTLMLDHTFMYLHG